MLSEFDWENWREGTSWNAKLLQACTGPEVSRSLGLSDFMTIGK